MQISHLAEDIYQQMSVKAIARAETFETAEQFIKWTRIAGNTRAIDVLRATVLRHLGIDHEDLTDRYAGRDVRLTDVPGGVLHDIIA